MQNNTIEELIQLKQQGKIGWCELALRSEHGKAYLQWCDDHGIEPEDNNAELYLEETESLSMTEATTLQRSLQRRSYNLSPEMQ